MNCRLYRNADIKCVDDRKTLFPFSSFNDKLHCYFSFSFQTHGVEFYLFNKII